MTGGALAGIRVCDFAGQLAGAGATKWLAAFGAEVIRIEDPSNNGAWDVLRRGPPFVDERRGTDFGGGFNNHNVGKLGLTLNVRTERGKALLTDLIRQSDVVTENFAAGVLDRWGFGYEQLKAIKPDIIYVSNCGFGHVGPYSKYKTWGPIVQAVSGLTFTSGLPDMEPAGWGFSYMDHAGGHYMTLAILMALVHREHSGKGQWVDLSCTDAGLTLNGVALLDFSVNGRSSRRSGYPDSNHADAPRMAPHGVYRAAGDDEWVAIACRDDADWQACAAAIGEPWARDQVWRTLDARLAGQQQLDEQLNAWTARSGKYEVQRVLQQARVPAAAVQRPAERIDRDLANAAFDLWPTVHHTKMGDVRVDGLPVRFLETPQVMDKGAPCLGEHSDEVLAGVLGLGADEIAALRAEGVV